MLSMSIGRTRAAFQIAKLWPNGSTIRIRFLGGSSQQQALVKQHAVEWAQYANLEFGFVSSANAQVRIAFNDDGAWSYVGRSEEHTSELQSLMRISYAVF